MALFGMIRSSFPADPRLLIAAALLAALILPAHLAAQGSAGSQISVTWNGESVTSGVSLTAIPGDAAQTSLVIYATSFAYFTATSDQSWLSLSPSSGLMGTSIASGAFVMLNADASSLTAGTYHAAITITASAGTATVSVTFKVASPGTLTLSPATMTFQYSLGGRSYPLGQSSAVTVTGTNAGTTFTATSLSDWLFVNGRTSTAGSIGSTAIISVDALTLGDPPVTGTYTGYVYFSANGMSGILTVNFDISGLTSGGAGSMSFYVPTVGGSAPSQPLAVSGAGPYVTVAAVLNADSNWISVSPALGNLTDSTVLTVSVNPSGLLAGTYFGTIRICSGQLVLQSVFVTMFIASPGNVTHLAAVPLNLTFSLAPGTRESQTAIVSGGGGQYKAQALGRGVSVSPPSGTTPALLTVSVDASGLVAGDVTVGYVVIQSNAGSQLITVTIKTLAGKLIEASPASVAVLLDSVFSPITNIQVMDVNEQVGIHQAFTVTAPSFVTLSTNSGTTPTSIGAVINTGRVGYGYNTGNIVINAPGAANSPLNIPVTVLATGSNTSNLAATPALLTLNGAMGGPAIVKSVSVSGATGTAFTAMASGTGSWLSVTPTSATSPATLTVTAKPGTLTAGDYQGTVTITTDGGLVTVLNVVLTVVGPSSVAPLLSLSGSQLTFDCQEGDSKAPDQTVQVSASGVVVKLGTVASANWITVNPASGMTNMTLRVGVIPGGLAAGIYTGAVTVISPDCSNSPQIIAVTMNIATRPVLKVNKSAVRFVWFSGSAPPGADSIEISSSAADLSFSVSTSDAPWLSVTPTRGMTPLALKALVNPVGMAAGTYEATVTVDATVSRQTIAVQLAVMPHLPTVTEFYNAASLLPGPIAPGEIVTIDGTGLGPASASEMVPHGNVVETSLSGTRVLVGGFPAPILYTSFTRVSAVVPYEIAGLAGTFVQVEYQQQRSNALNVDVTDSSPGIFAQAIFNEDGSRNSSENTASKGSVIVLYATGEGQTLPAGADGELAMDMDSLPRPKLLVTATIGGLPADVVYAGAAPTAVAGLLQVNIRIPAGSSSGELILKIGGKSSQDGVTIAIGE